MKRRFSLKRNKQFRQVYRKGKSLACREMAMVYCRSRCSHIRVGFSVGKKLGNSVVRNRIKRRLREAFRPNIPLLLPNYDLIFIAREGVKTAEMTKLQDSMRYLLRKAGLYQNQKPPRS